MPRPIQRPLLVAAHPDPDSFAMANLDAARRGFERGGATVDVIDLYRDGFSAAMTREERLAYLGDEPILSPQVADYAERVLAADAIAFIYPTWWSGLPAILKGFLERTLVPGVAFKFHPRSIQIRPGLGNIRRIIGVSTYGSPRPYVAFVNDNGRRTLTRTLRLSAGVRTRTTWLGLYAMDGADDVARATFLTRVEVTMAKLAGAAVAESSGGNDSNDTPDSDPAGTR